jgi:UDP-N-acetylglucosamine 1-carboxyvinyltransferase
MDKILIGESRNLKGELNISTSKNACLPIIAASLLTDEDVTILNIPALTDITNMLKILRGFGAEVNRDKANVTINSKNIHSPDGDEKCCNKLRASILFLGPLLSKFGEAVLPLPGGCKIGKRSIDLHLSSLKKMGAQIKIDGNKIYASAKKLKGAKITLEYPSVGATENILLASCLVQNTTEIKNAASEPEVLDLINFLNACGARVYGGGSKHLFIEGVPKLYGCTYMPIKDRIEAGTLLMASIFGKDVFIKNSKPIYLKPITNVLIEAGAEIHPLDDGLRIFGGKTLKAQKIISAPYPAFPTDLQAPYTALACTMNGISKIRETVFEDRFSHTKELCKMGAKIIIRGKTAYVFGEKNLKPAKVYGSDLRATASLVIAGLIAKGQTEIYGIDHLDRGYENFEQKLALIGANIKRVKV